MRCRNSTAFDARILAKLTIAIHAAVVKKEREEGEAPRPAPPPWPSRGSKAPDCISVKKGSGSFFLTPPPF